jgi:hypothetical protein
LRDTGLACFLEKGFHGLNSKNNGKFE